MKKLGEQEFYGYFNKIRQKKITNKIIHEQENITKCFVMILGMIASLIGVVILEAFDSDLSSTCYALFIVFVLIIFGIAIAMDNKSFTERTLLDQQFYLLYLMREHIYKNRENKKYTDQMYSILRVYKRTIKKNIQFIKDATVFQVSRSELILNKIFQDFQLKMTGALCEKKITREVEQILDILLNIVLTRIEIERHVDDISGINKEIDSLLEEYCTTMNVISEDEYSLSKIKKFGEKIESIDSRIKWGVAISVVAIIYIIACYLFNEVIVTGVFAIIVPLGSVAFSSINKKNSID